MLVASSIPCRNVLEQDTEPLIASLLCLSLWIKASAKCKLNLNVNVVVFSCQKIVIVCVHLSWLLLQSGLHFKLHKQISVLQIMKIERFKKS